MMEVDWILVISFLLVAPIPLFFLFYCILKVTLDRRVIKALPVEKEYSCPLDWYFGFMRVIGFSYAVVFEWANKSHMIRDYYDGIDLKLFANPFEKVMSYLFVLNIMVFILAAIFMSVTSALGILDWQQ